jgi:2-keto-4-pentenoate hydratase/2-oxohepta-3-ene-1,7-dioic acid hydratase in catechol pathway
MKIARFDGGRIGVVVGERIYGVSAACGVDPKEWPPVGIVRVIAGSDALRPAIETAVERGAGRPLAEVRLETPVPWPHNLLALPNNYAAHTAEMRGRPYAVGNSASPLEAGFFYEGEQLADRAGRGNRAAG